MQIGVYELLAQSALATPINAPAQIIGLQTGKSDKGRRVGTGEITGAKSILLDAEDGSPGYLRMAANMLHAGNFYGNPKSMLCNEKFCPAYQSCRWRK